MINVLCKCPCCGKESIVEMAYNEYTRYMDGKENVQNIFPNMSIGTREMLISGMCLDCQERFFGDAT